MKRSSSWKPNKIAFLFVLAAFGVVGGIVALRSSKAAPNIVINTSIPQPQNVQVNSENQSLIVTWDDTRPPPSGVVGWYVQYKRKGAATWENVRQTIHAAIQLQPLENGVEYEITVQTARGSYLTTASGNLTEADSHEMYWARADGNVSPAVTVSGTPSAARVDAMRQRLTGFFDDFNVPANPMDELKWNNAAFGHSECEDQSSAFINAQVHVHNAISCGFGGIVSRPRATFDTSVGLNGGPISEANPAQIEWDMDLMVDGRSKWYLDLIPLTARRDGFPIDVDGHHTADDAQDKNDPGNMLRLDVQGGGYGLAFTYWDKNRDVRKLAPEATVCGLGNVWDSNVDFRSRCTMTNKTLNMSPLPELTMQLIQSPQNVRRHWVMQLTPTKVRVFVDGALIEQTSLPADWVAEKKYTLQNTMFSYNTAKQYTTGINCAAPSSCNLNEPSLYYARRGVIPKFHFYHWDNFGFTGPRPTTVVHNYIDGGTDGSNPMYILKSYGNQQHPRQTIVKVPDDIGSPISSRLYFSIASNNGSYIWKQGDYIVFNSKRYDYPSMTGSMVNPPARYDDVGPPAGGLGADVVSTSIPINPADIRKGNNNIEIHLNGQIWSGLATNLHLELEYPIASAPPYTQPITIYGQPLSNIVEPKMTNCDQYIYVEQDIGLPYLNGKPNLEPGPCVFLQTTPHHHGVGVILNLTNFEAEDGTFAAPITSGDDPNASKGKYIRF